MEKTNLKRNKTKSLVSNPLKEVSRETGLLPSIGRKLAAIRNECKITNEEIAQASGISVVTVSNLLNGKLDNTSITTVEKITQALGVRLEILILT